MLYALILSDDTDTVVSLSDVFRETGFTVRVSSSLQEARTALMRDLPDVALMDYSALGAKGFEFLEKSRLGDVLELLLVTGDPGLDSAVRGMQVGAADYFTKPIDSARLKQALDRIVAATRQRASRNARVVKAGGAGIMHGNSAPMRRLFGLLRKVSPTEMAVLLSGESGVGKELAAQVIHKLSSRSASPLVAVNCGAISAEILESELFGHEKGSFTGATRRHIGFFEQASGGTLFLDEITEMSPALQVKLLRILESMSLRRVGGEEELPVDVRLIAATNRDPGEALEDGSLREDLYYRLAQFPIRVPALRERDDDILMLAELFLSALNEESPVAKQFSPEVRELIRLHSWPGNVRELSNAIARAHVLAGDIIEADDLPPGVVDGGPIDHGYLRIAVGQPLAEAERRLILATLDQLGGNKKAAASTLGISPRTLYTKLKSYSAN